MRRKGSGGGGVFGLEAAEAVEEEIRLGQDASDFGGNGRHLAEEDEASPTEMVISGTRLGRVERHGMDERSGLRRARKCWRTEKRRGFPGYGGR